MTRHGRVFGGSHSGAETLGNRELNWLIPIAIIVAVIKDMNWYRARLPEVERAHHGVG